jgi:Tfp pilus assembly protein PilZ
MTSHRRLDVRYAIQFPAQLLHARRSYSLVTEDVSHGGIFLRTETPPPLMQLVQVRLVLPIGGHALSAHGMTVHVVEPSNAKGRVPGIGVQFYALDHATRDAWEGFVRHVAASYPESADQTPLRMKRGMTPEPLSRRFIRHTAVLELRPETVAALEELHRSELSAGEIFVPTTKALAPGTEVVIHVLHPGHGGPFLFEGKVKSRSTVRRGLTVELVGVDGRTKSDFLEFVHGPIVVDEEVVVPPGSDRGA